MPADGHQGADTMQVIGAGLPRTGTLTQKLALEQLGLAPCYHWVNLIADLDQVELWHRAFDGEDLWAEIFDGQQATVDWPGGFFYAELAEAYPEAKVLLSVRDPQAWERSYRETIWDMCFGDSLIHHLSAARREVDPRWRRSPGGRPGGRSRPAQPLAPERSGAAEDELGRGLQQGRRRVVPGNRRARDELWAQAPGGSEVEDRRHHRPRHGAPDVQVHAPGVELEQGERRLGRELADRRAAPAPLGQAQGGDEPLGRGGRIDGHGEGAQRALRLALDDLRPEPLRHLQAIGIGVDVGDRRRAQRQRRVDRVEGDRAPGTAGNDEHVCAGVLGEGRRHRPPAVGHVVGGAGDDRRVHPLGQGDEHRFRVGDEREVAEHAAPLAAQRAEAVHRQRRDARAIARLPAPAALAGAARDLERHDHLLSGLKALRPLHDLGDALVSEVDRELKRRLAEDHRLVEVTRRHRQRAHDRLALVPALRLGRVLPDDAARVLENERAHQTYALRRRAEARGQLRSAPPLSRAALHELELRLHRVRERVRARQRAHHDDELIDRAAIV